LSGAERSEILFVCLKDERRLIEGIESLGLPSRIACDPIGVPSF
jgi:hypothetical protein